MADDSTPLLSVKGVTLRFGGVVALDSVTFDVMPGQIAGLIGPNGAGKTTLFNCLSRLYQPSSGRSDLKASRSWRCRATVFPASVSAGPSRTWPCSTG